jgi:hypothetical protein
VATIHVEKTLAAPIERVFGEISDHAGYSRFPGIQSSVVTKEGDTEPNGLGAVREIRARPLTFTEEITAFERPHRMDYLILDVNAPIRHHGGSIVLTEDGSATHVDWTSSFDSTLPVLGRAYGAVAAALLGLGFRRMLGEVEQLAAAPEAQAAAARA